MIKLIVFDMDGTLIDLKAQHKLALNEALAEVDEKYVISEEDHLKIFDALPTKKKLEILSRTRGLPRELRDKIAARKQFHTAKYLEQLTPDTRLCEILERLKADNFTLAVASNSIRETIRLALTNTGLINYIDFYLSNEDVRNPKPNCEMFLKAMVEAGAEPEETLILEDSTVGFKAVEASGAWLCPVLNSEDITWEKLERYIRKAENRKVAKAKPKNDKMNVLIPMAGRGSRFEAAGYSFPKPLIDVRGKPMIQVVVENLNVDAHHIFIVQKSHYETYNLKHLLNLISPGCDIVQVDGITEGAACTVLLAKELINNDAPLLLANSDQFVEWDSAEFLEKAERADGSILTFTAVSPKWSFAKVDEGGWVSEVAEKKPISNVATVGIYYFKRGADFVRSAEQMIAKDLRVNGEFYVCPVFNEAIENGLRINSVHIEKNWGLGVPEDLHYFLSNYDGKI